ncbi:DUF2087 domain-containing protein [Burkholderia sp. ABCPW 14]|uniref:DUF2087 domain-containing protein n=1 Tax=Burkholderia sp. ABCPW 14 TaxID=1637860 RepID=UPI001E53A105|nr:DUF2087 domain-containing protein [Burkholderia sp. ABCPW 14]
MPATARFSSRRRSSRRGRIGTRYTESEISKICQLLTIDYARLRRYLVDRGVLQRQDNVYRRVLSQ